MKSQFIEYLASAPAGESDSGANSGRSGSVLGQAREAATQAARESASKLKATATRAREETVRVATDKKDEAAQRVGGYSSALHQSASALEEKDPNIAWFTHRVADRVQGVADYVRERDWGNLRSDADDLARRHPAAFFGGLLFAGLVLGNLLKASRTDDSPSRGPALDDSRDSMGSEDFASGSPAELGYSNQREDA